MNKNAFRECFDNAYDDICDGLVGCLAWYASPATPIAVAIYCEATT